MSRDGTVKADRSDAASWPVASMLLYGTFGGDASPQSLRADRRSRVAFGVFFALEAALLVAPVPMDVKRALEAALVGALFATLAWLRWQYAMALDELARRLYLEAFAVTYLIGLSLLVPFGLLHSLAGWTVHPLIFVVLEPLRGLVLVWRSRQVAA